MASQAGPQFGGQIVDYEHGLSFTTVHGSGHMVPTFRPRECTEFRICVGRVCAWMHEGSPPDDDDDDDDTDDDDDDDDAAAAADDQNILDKRMV